MCNGAHHPPGCNCGFGPQYPRGSSGNNPSPAPKPATSPPKDRRPPTVRTEEARKVSILKNKKAIFPCAANPAADERAPLYRSHRLGVEAILKYGKIADSEAKKQGVDPIMVRAILYYENADGHKGGLDKKFDEWGWSRSQKPMSLRADIWGSLGVKRDSPPLIQIRAAVTLIKRITERLENPTPDRIGTLWNYLPATKVTTRGARIGQIYEDEPWLGWE